MRIPLVFGWVIGRNIDDRCSLGAQRLSNPSLRVQCAITSHGAGVHPKAGLAVSTGRGGGASRAYLVAVSSTPHARAPEVDVTSEPLRAALASPSGARPSIWHGKTLVYASGKVSIGRAGYLNDVELCNI